jgi:tetratricopeptide (TPR) repeat protein
MGPILLKANEESIKPAPDVNKFLILKDVYKTLGRWKEAAEACARAAQMRQEDMDLQRELKDLGAQQTMNEGNYSAGGSFRDSIRDRDKQQKLMNSDKDFQDADVQAQFIRDAEEQYAADPNEAGKLMKLVDALVKTEDPDKENRAVELLQAWYDKSRQYRFRMTIGDIHMRQFSRMERGKREALKANPKDETLRKDYIDFMREKTEFELNEFKARVDAYPTETKYKFEVGRRQFELGQFDEAIPTLQQSRNDPKFRYKAGIYLGRSFLEGGYIDEADDTFAQLINDYQMRGDADSKEMYYWRGRTLEKKNGVQDAIKHYSQVAQWDFNYRDVQARIKALRAAGK